MVKFIMTVCVFHFGLMIALLTTGTENATVKCAIYWIEMNQFFYILFTDNQKRVYVDNAKCIVTCLNIECDNKQMC